MKNATKKATALLLSLVCLLSAATLSAASSAKPHTLVSAGTRAINRAARDVFFIVSISFSLNVVVYAF